MQAAWEGAPDAATRWRQLREAVDNAIAQADAAKLPPETRMALEVFIPAVVITYTYPRLDVKMSECLYGWQKAPFSVHLVTGRIRVPIDPATVDDFVLDRVPLVRSLAASRDTAALAPYLDTFQRFVDGCCTAAARGADTAHPDDAAELASAAPGVEPPAAATRLGV